MGIDLCIVGAGVVGLNAAFVASPFLPETARVLIFDKHRQAGGMWNDAYSYVRLHQPYQLFTAGDIAWTLGRERSYLATGPEVAAHLRHCLEVISKRFDVEPIPSTVLPTLSPWSGGRATGAPYTRWDGLLEP